MRIVDIADSLLSEVEGALEAATGWLEPTLRLGVTGLSGAGKTVFITSLAQSLLERGRMQGLSVVREGRILGAAVGRQPDPGLPRFPLEANRAALTAEQARWPSSTRMVSQLRISIRYRPASGLAAFSGPSTLHLDIVDYPGEWLVDLALLETGYDAWSSEALAAAESPARAPHAGGWRDALSAADPAVPHGEPAAERLAQAYAGYLAACRAAGLAALAPGRFLMPGDLEGSPALTFAPLPETPGAGRGSIREEMAKRFEDYKRVVVEPFFRDHFAKLDRQVVLIDALGALARGPRALGDVVQGLSGTLAAFRHGRSGFFERLIGGRRIDRLLVAASKADHLPHTEHGRLSQLVEAMVAEAASRAAYQGAEIRSMSIAAVRATAEQEIDRGGQRRLVVRGRRLDTRREVAGFAGGLPEDLRALVAAAADPGRAPKDWPDARFAEIAYAPPAWGGRPGDGPPHIRLDKALEFLIGDRLD